jgi:hypothetical protein
MNYNRITYLELECTCVSCNGINHWEQLMKGHKRADKKQIDRLVKKLLPDLHYELALQYYNPYHYHKTKRHLILVHSGIEYFLKYN